MVRLAGSHNSATNRTGANLKTVVVVFIFLTARSNKRKQKQNIDNK